MPPKPASAYEPLDLLDVVQAVAQAARAPDPSTISQRAWDAGREGAYADVPSARAIAAFLKLPWEKVRELAFSSGPGRSIALGRGLGREQQDWLTPEYASFALNLVAQRLGKRSVSPSEYTQAVETLLAEDNAHWLHGRKLLLPNAEQLRVAAGTWDAALHAAGLHDSQSIGYGRKKAPPNIIEILERCFEAHGTEPTASDSEIFARANAIPYPRKKQAWATYVSEWKEQRRSKGLAVPDRPPPTSERPDYSLDVGAGLSGERRMEDRKDFDAAVAWAMRYLAQLRPGERATQRGYNAWAVTQDGAFYNSSFQRHHGGWAKVRDAARERLNA